MASTNGVISSYLFFILKFGMSALSPEGKSSLRFWHFDGAGTFLKLLDTDFLECFLSYCLVRGLRHIV